MWNHQKQLALGEFGVRVNLPFPTRQVRLPMSHLILPIQGLPNLISNVIPLISHIQSHSPYHSHLHPPQHPPNNVCLLFIVRNMSWPLGAPSPSSNPLYQIDRHQPALHESLKERLTCHLPRVATWLTDKQSFISTGHATHRQHLFSVQSQSIMGSKCISRIARSRCWSAWPSSLGHGLRRYITSCSIMTSQFAWSWHQSASPNSLNHNHQGYIKTGSITTCEFARSSPWSWCPNSLPHAVRVHRLAHSITHSMCIFKLARLWPAKSRCHCLPRASPNSLNYSLQVCGIMPSKCISTLTCRGPPSASLCLLIGHLQVHLKVVWSTACSQSRCTVCGSVAI